MAFVPWRNVRDFLRNSLFAVLYRFHIVHDVQNFPSAYLILLGDDTGACSAITGNTEVNLSVGRRRRAVRDDNRQTSLCRCGVCSCALYLLSIAPTSSWVAKKLSSVICGKKTKLIVIPIKKDFEYKITKMLSLKFTEQDKQGLPWCEQDLFTLHIFCSSAANSTSLNIWWAGVAGRFMAEVPAIADTMVASAFASRRFTAESKYVQRRTRATSEGRKLAQLPSQATISSLKNSSDSWNSDDE